MYVEYKFENTTIDNKFVIWSRLIRLWGNEMIRDK